jgi:hypothetical protein
MKLACKGAALLAILSGMGGCNSNSGDTWPVPDARQIVAAIQRTPEEKLLVAASSSGGGAGDDTYRVLACKAGGERCELLASIDTNDKVAPALSKSRDGIALTINASDYIADFRNFSRETTTLQPGEFYLRYRGQTPAGNP